MAKPKDFVERVKELREERKLSQAELASAARISPAHLSRILSGERPLRMDQAVALAQALGVTVIELTAGTSVADVVAAWVPRQEYEAADRLRADAERDLELAQTELHAAKAETASLRESVRSLTSRAATLESDLVGLRAEAGRASQLAKKNGDLERQVLQLNGEIARLTSHAEQFRQQVVAATELANRNYGAWASARNQVQTLERSLATEKSEKVGVGVVCAALGGLAAAMLASPAETGRRRRV